MEQESYKVPEDILKKLFEHTGSGYLLFALDENEDVVVYRKTEGHGSLILETFAKNWLKAVEQLDVDRIAVDMFEIINGPSDDEEEAENEEDLEEDSWKEEDR